LDNVLRAWADIGNTRAKLSGAAGFTLEVLERCAIELRQVFIRLLGQGQIRSSRERPFVTRGKGSVKRSSSSTAKSNSKKTSCKDAKKSAKGKNAATEIVSKSKGANKSRSSRAKDSTKKGVV